MLAVLFGVIASIAWGGASIFGGQAARSASAFTVAWWFSGLALPGMTLMALLTSGVDGLNTRSLFIGAIAGVGAVTGGTFLFFGLARAPASSVVPASGFLSALLPVAVAATLGGEDLTALAAVGVAVAVGAIWLVASDGRRFDLRGVWYGIGSGTSFGVQFAILGFADPGAGLWPVVGVFVGATMVGTVVLLVTNSSRRLPRTALALTAGGSVCSMIANTTYLTATRLGALSTAAILAALYAIPTVVLAALFLKQRMLLRHWVGLGLAGLATAFVAV